MPAAVSKSPSSPPQKVEQKPGKDRDFSDILIWEKIKYVVSKFPVPIGALIPSLKYTPDRWKPTSIEWQNTEHLRNLKWHGISALTAIRVAAFVVFAGIIVAAVFAAPLIGVATMFLSILPLTFMLMVGTYHLLFLLTKPSNDDDNSYTKGAIEMVAKKVKESPPNLFAVQTDIDRNEYEKKKKHAKDGPKEQDVATEKGGQAPQAKPAKPVKPAAEPVKPPQPQPAPKAANTANLAQDPIAKDTRKISQTEFAKATKNLCQTTLEVNAQLKPEVLANPLGPPAKKLDTKIVVVPATSTQMAEKLVQDMRLRPAVLNMANETTPGGTFLTGGTAQEEQLCRQSNLYEALEAAAKANPSLYPIDPFGAILTPQVTFFKDDANKRTEPFHVDVITSAAYNCNESGGNKPNTEAAYRDGTKKKIQAMLRVASMNGNDSLVLSAYGCGVFGNDPIFMSNLFKEVLEEPESEFKGRFQAVVFAIPGGKNFTEFQKTFSAPAAEPPPPPPA